MTNKCYINNVDITADECSLVRTHHQAINYHVNKILAEIHPSNTHNHKKKDSNPPHHRNNWLSLLFPHFLLSLAYLATLFYAIIRLQLFSYSFSVILLCVMYNINYLFRYESFLLELFDVLVILLILCVSFSTLVTMDISSLLAMSALVGYVVRIFQLSSTVELNRIIVLFTIISTLQAQEWCPPPLHS
jgi:hypothetical protein